MNQMNLNELLSGDIGAWLWWIIPALFAVVLLKNCAVRRFFHRFQADVRARCELDEETYHLFSNPELSFQGKSLVVDRVYLSKYGIFVVNTPNQCGRIWAGKEGGLWKQRFHKAESMFDNPIEHNHQYIQALSYRLRLPVKYFHSVVVFAGSRFETMMPDNVLDVVDFKDYVAQFDEILLDDDKLNYLHTLLDASEFDAVFEEISFSRQAWNLS